MFNNNLWLCSELCKDIHPKNNGCEFTNELNVPLNFSAGNWHVAATELIYEPSFWQNVRKTFSAVQLEVSNVETIGYDGGNAMTAKTIKIRPVGNAFPESDDDPYVMHVAYNSHWNAEWKVNRVIMKFLSTRLDNRDVYGKPIEWKSGFRSNQTWTLRDTHNVV